MAPTDIQDVSADAFDGSSVDENVYHIAALPPYLRQMIIDISNLRDGQESRLSTIPSRDGEDSVQVLPLREIQSLLKRTHQYFHLLLLRHQLSNVRIPNVCESQGGIAPELLLERARVYEALAYPDLAAGDVLVAFTVCEYAEDGGGDLEAVWLDDKGCEDLEEDDMDGKYLQKIAQAKRLCAGVMVRCLKRLSADQTEIDRWDGILKGLIQEASNADTVTPLDETDVWCLFSQDESSSVLQTGAFSTGASRREIYPWNGLEGDRLSDEAMKEINTRLATTSQGLLEVRKSVLPTLSTGDVTGLARATADVHILENEGIADKSAHVNAQLGLFALNDLPPNGTILTERSALTAIRPHGAALCDACAGDLSNIDKPTSDPCYSCPGCAIPFCSEECQSIASSTYHVPNVDASSTDEGFPPSESPFCSGTDGDIPDISNLGRAESSITPEWDLYFLLVVRALQMAETLDVHPLSLWECKYIWGDFNPKPSVDTLSHSGPTVGLQRTLPFSPLHSLHLPLQFFELLLLSRAESMPYTRKWLARYDWWVIQTLYAKFRGVADAKLSSWSGEPETASVYPLWCLANHSCEPGVTWEGGGVRRLVVRGESVGGEVHDEVSAEETGKWEGIRKGEEVWNHYTDVREKDYRIRRGRLLEVLGGDCRCSRCLREEVEAREKNGR